MSIDGITVYEVWEHSVSTERFLVRIEREALTGVYGPLPTGEPVPEPGTVEFEDHVDDLEWIVRASEHFRLVSPPYGARRATRS